MPRSRKAAAGGGGGGTGKTKAGGASKPKGKSSKNRRAVAGVGVDFSRVKRKVGRTLAPAANATDTTVTAKSITLPSQSVAENRKGMATTGDRDLSLQELLSQLSHYSARVRRDALSGIAELARGAPTEVRRHGSGGSNGGVSSSSSNSSFSSPLEALAERAADPDPEVRAALRGALAAVAAAVGPPGVAPFLPLLMAHCRRAMGSPDPRTRADALALAAEAVAAAKAKGGRGRGRSSSLKTSSSSPSNNDAALVGPALAACAAQLNPAARASSLRAGSLQALQASLKGVRAFLEAASEGGGGGGGGEEESGEDGDDDEDEEDEEDEAAAALESSRRPLYSFRCAWAPALTAVAPAAEGFAEDDDDDDSESDGEEKKDLENELLPTGVAPLLAALCSAWSDLCPKGLMMPSQGSKAGPQSRSTTDADEDDDVERSLAACDLLACARLLLISSSSSSSSSPAVAAAAIKAASPLGRAVGSVLPAPPPAGKGTARKDALDAAAALNVEAARFLARLLPGGSESFLPSLPPWTARLLGWCDAALATGDALPRGEGDGRSTNDGAENEDEDGGEGNAKKRKKSKTSSSSSPPSILRPLPDAALAAVVAASERGLAAVGARHRSAAHAASLSALASRSPPGSRARGVAVRAVARALLSGENSTVSEEAAASWVPLLPRVVWEEAAASASKKKKKSGGGGGSAASALVALHAAARRCAPEWSQQSKSNSPLAAALRAVAPSLAPLVLVIPPAPGATKAAPGALSRLASSSSSSSSSQSWSSSSRGRCSFLFADALEHLPCLAPAPLLRALVCAAASPSSPYPLEFAERALSAVARAVASAASAANDESDDDDDDDGPQTRTEAKSGISPEDARAWASALLFLLSGAGERVEVVESSSKEKRKEATKQAPSSPLPLLPWQRHSRVVAAATRALRVSSGNGVGAAVELLSDGLLEAAGVTTKKETGGEEDDEEQEAEGRRGRAAAGALAALCSVVAPLPSDSPSPHPEKLLEAVPLLFAAYARGGGGCAAPAGMGAELVLQALRRRTGGGGGGGGGGGATSALAETLDLLLLPSSSSSSSLSPTSIVSSCALIGAIAGDSSLRSSLLEERAASAARAAVKRARDAAAKATGAKEKVEASAAAASADAALAAALGS